ncbi:hypothetical protein [Stratiformator vulcanicus]|uniref:Uncharacterized protein n=1 Tax=Stratiformator vulcanicus TaxID=2527980 RepID=A0A517QYT8_9PLAN|nr:hypothetical protein [Stratiformator vulcanicus]QDT36768.1 hypothetical protein Pan189_11310 [Stratiformator vulcanicus]
MSENEPNDRRLYVSRSGDWKAHIKADFTKQHCYSKNPGEDFYHLIVGGEIYVDDGAHKLCLNCALRTGVITLDRLHWQKSDT